MKTAGTMFLSALLHEASAVTHLAFGPIEHLFTEDFEKPAYQWVKEFASKYGTLPHPNTFEDATKLDLPEASEPPAYYLGLLRDRFTHDKLIESLEKAQKILAEKHDGAQALEVLAGTVLHLVADKQADFILDFRHSSDLVMQAYYANKGGQEEGLQLGWPTLDEMTGGLVKGDLISIVGRPSLGKSWLLCYAAYHAWATQKKAPLLVSMEMSTLVVAQRLASLHTKLKFGQIKDGALPTWTGPGGNIEKQFAEKLSMLKDAEVPFWLLEGNLYSSVADIQAIARQLKPDAIYIDGAYLLTHPTERDRFQRVAENADLIKKELTPLCPVFCSWQFNRDGAKKKVKDVGLEHIGYSDAIGQISSVVLGLFEEDSSGTAKQRLVRILKGRNGESGKFATHWNFDSMDFSESPAVGVVFQFDPTSSPHV
jgi:replicative DNA helicase